MPWNLAESWAIVAAGRLRRIGENWRQLGAINYTLLHLAAGGGPGWGDHVTLVHTEFGDRHGHGGIMRPFATRGAEGLRFIGERIYEGNHDNGEDRDSYVAARLAAEPARVARREDLLRLSLPNSFVAEVGVFRGEFAERILGVCKPAELHLLDLWSGSATSGDKDGTSSPWRT